MSNEDAIDGSGSHFAWRVTDLPCPVCNQRTVIGYHLVNELGGHQHTKYICTFWRSGVRPDLTGALYPPCGWTGWSVPGWDEDES